jgi:hypothetical protein
MSEKLTIRIGAETADAQADIKRLQAEIAGFNAEKLQAQFKGSTEAARAAGEAIKRLQVDLAGFKATALRDKLGQDAKDSARIVKEAVSSISSELIEGLRVDGDIANILGKQISELSVSTLVLGGATAGITAAAAGLIALTAQAATQARQIQLSADALGIGTQQLQLYSRASEAAGVSSDALTDAFAKFKEQTGGNAEAFDAFLRSLEAIEDPARRLAVAQGRLGELSDDARKAILALTEQGGELRREILASGLVMSEFEVRDLAKVERRFESLTIKVEGFAKRALLASIDAFAEFGVALGEGSEGLARMESAQKAAEEAAKRAAGAIKNQAAAVNELRIAIDNANEAGIRAELSRKIDDIVKGVSAGAPRALKPGEARAVIEARKAQDETFKEGIAQARIFAQNRKLIEDLINPPESSSGGKKGPDRAAAREQAAEGLQKMLNEARRDAVINLKDIDALRFATDGYTKSLQAEIEKFQGFIVLSEGQAKQFAELTKIGHEAARSLNDVFYESANLQLQWLGTFADAEILAIKGKAKVEREAEDERYAATQKQIKDQLKANEVLATDDTARANQKLANQQTLNKLLEAEQQRHTAAMAAIDRNETVQVETATPGSVRNKLGGGTSDELRWLSTWYPHMTDFAEAAFPNRLCSQALPHF